MNNSFKKIMFLFTVFTFLIFVDSFKITDIIGYKKTKDYIKTDINIFALAKGFFGDNIYSFYNTESSVNQPVYNIVESGNGQIIYTHENTIYSNYIGTVSKVYSYRNYYNLVIDIPGKKIHIKYLRKLNLSIYDKVEIDTIIGECDGWYYYEEI